MRKLGHASLLRAPTPSNLVFGFTLVHESAEGTVGAQHARADQDSLPYFPSWGTARQELGLQGQPYDGAGGSVCSPDSGLDREPWTQRT